MVSTCCAYKCKARHVKGSAISFHAFPNDVLLRKKWIIATKRENFVPSKNTRICSKHFKDTDYVINFGRKTLIKGVVPTIFDTFQHKQKKVGTRKTRHSDKNEINLQNTAKRMRFSEPSGTSGKEAKLKDSSASRIPLVHHPVPVVCNVKLDYDLDASGSSLTYGKSVDYANSNSIIQSFKDEKPNLENIEEKFNTNYGIAHIKMEKDEELMEDEYERNHVKDNIHSVDIKIEEFAHIKLETDEEVMKDEYERNDVEHNIHCVDIKIEEFAHIKLETDEEVTKNEYERNHVQHNIHCVDIKIEEFKCILCDYVTMLESDLQLHITKDHD